VPWLLRFFDQIRFYPVTADELEKLREDFPLGRFTLRTEATTFSLKAYQSFLNAEAEGIAEFRHRQRTAFVEERERWAAAGQLMVAQEPEVEVEAVLDDGAPDGCELIRTSLTGNLWKVLVQVGDTIQADQPVAIVEAMKMEADVISSFAGKVIEVRVVPGKPVQSGQALIVIQLENPS
jgi:urea carboxylase